MKPRGIAAVVVVAVVVISLAASAELGLLPAIPGDRNGNGTTSCASCSHGELIVDILMPAVGPPGGSNPNRWVNLTVGSSGMFEVDVYPTSAVTLSMSFSSFFLSAPAGDASATSGGGRPEASFQPGTLSLGANKMGVTYLQLTVPYGTERGTYGAVVSASDVSNDSEVWGLYFQLGVS
jgi:hypothetical protein